MLKRTMKGKAEPELYSRVTWRRQCAKVSYNSIVSVRKTISVRCRREILPRCRNHLPSGIFVKCHNDNVLTSLELTEIAVADQYMEHKRLGNATIHPDDLVKIWYVSFIPTFVFGALDSALLIFSGQSINR
uniref:G_PROTEIN_RECEP_F1_2 domain-containing protein n=1 Tax=Angiostrongylus cantonensis TaxID=6313 RepID=A0A0K0DRQ7_ANGCA